ncbi:MULTISPECIES: S1 family peptidase [Nocardioides]|uniref:S1 family peptidase n=1 Tax=Nocardioides vastitatis TaxID=2568655 RepID=A0ABW0ZIQ8_9ACTN|nr:serine protease [Nocardioides sp.]THJ04504.1 serine protease [Nocardioides sp.]
MRSRTIATLATAACLAAAGLSAAGPAEAIVGGYQVTDDRFAFMASIQDAGANGTDGHFCGGSVISQRWVLTAAHCIDLTGVQAKDIQVAVGRDNLDQDLAEGQTLLVDRIEVHPDYDGGPFDAALVHVTEDITSAPAIPLVARGEDTLEQDGARLTVAGWGTEFFGSPAAAAQLKAVDVRAVADSSCTTNQAMGFEPDLEICASELLGDSCQGDSGGPLFGTLPDGRRVQVGIVSYGLGCATPGFPGVYAEVNNASIHQFITGTAGLTGTTATRSKKER